MGQSIGMYTANIDQVVECMFVNLFQVQSQIYQIVVVLSFLIFCIRLYGFLRGLTERTVRSLTSHCYSLKVVILILR